MATRRKQAEAGKDDWPFHFHPRDKVRQTRRRTTRKGVPPQPSLCVCVPWIARTARVNWKTKRTRQPPLVDVSLASDASDAAVASNPKEEYIIRRVLGVVSSRSLAKIRGFV